jgi:hypothetical protein
MILIYLRVAVATKGPAGDGQVLGDGLFGTEMDDTMEAMMTMTTTGTEMAVCTVKLFSTTA